MTQTITLAAGQVSQIISVSPGTRITSSGNGYISWVAGSLVDAKNGSGTWAEWAKGSSAGYMDAVRQMCIRATATGNMTVTLDEGRADKYPENVYFDTELASVQTNADGSVSLVGADGDRFKLTETRKVILIGDSITAQNWGATTFNDALGEAKASLPEGYDTYLGGYAEAANALMGLPYTFVNAGKSGMTTTWMLSTLPTVIGNHPDACEVWWHGGTNDIAASATDGTIVANTQAAYELARAAGMIFVWNSTIMAAASQGWTTAQRNTLARANSRIRLWLSTRPGVDIVDSSGLFLDTADANGWSRVDFLKDGLHPSNSGGIAWGMLVADTIAYRVKGTRGGVEHPADAYAVDNTAMQLVADPLHLGATGASAGTGVTGTQISALTIGRMSGGASDTAVASVVASPDGVGKAQKLVITAGTGACDFRILDAVSNPGAANVAGKTYRFSAYIKCINVTNFQSAELHAIASLTSATYPSIAVYGMGAGGTDGYTNSGTFTLRVAIDVLFPTDVTAITSIQHYLRIYFAGTGDGEFEIYRRSCKQIA